MQDASVFELIYDILSGRQRSDEVEPLDVAVDERGLHIVRGHRRGLALGMLQGIWRDRTVLAPCCLYDAKDPKVASQFADMDTQVDGLAVQLHGKRAEAEAWHRGKPLFRGPQEWCDQRADVPVEVSTTARFNKSDSDGSEAMEISAVSCQSDALKLKRRSDENGRLQETSRAEIGFDRRIANFGSDQGSGFLQRLEKQQLDYQDPPDTLPETQDPAVCCLWLVGKCSEKGRHSLGKRLYLHEDVPGLQCGFGSICKYKHYETRMGCVPSDAMQDLSKTSPRELKAGMVVCVTKRNGSVVVGKVIEIFQRAKLQNAQVRVHYSDTDQAGQMKKDRFPLNRMQVPDFSQIKPGMQATTVEAMTGKNFDCHVLQVSEDADRIEAPVYVRYTGFATCHDEWVGADRFRSKLLSFHDAVLPAKGKVGTHSESQEERQLGPSAALRYGSAQQDPPAIASTSEPLSSRDCEGRTSPPGELKEGMVVCVTKRNGSVVVGKVIEIFQRAKLQNAQVRVHYSDTDQAGQMKKDRFPLNRTQVPDFSQIKPGMQATTVEAMTGKNFDCHVLQVSEDADRIEAPVYVRYTGFATCHDEWVGADRFRSKLLSFHDAVLPAKGKVGTHSESQEERQLGPSAASRYGSAQQDPPAIASTSEPLSSRDCEGRTSPPGELKEGMVVCVTKRNGSSGSKTCAVVVEISEHPKNGIAAVRVKYSAADSARELHEEWLSLHKLQVPDFSSIKKGMQASGRKNLDCQVLQVSKDKLRAHAPVHVRYTGSASHSCPDEWLGADRFRSKLLMFHDAVLPAKSMMGAHFKSLEECQQVSCRTSRFPTHAQICPMISGAAQSSTELRRPSVTQDVVSRAVIEELPDASPTNALPWHEPGFETDAFDHALQATEEALERQGRQRKAEQWQPRLEATLASADTTEALRDVLEKHGWSGRGDKSRIAEFLLILNIFISVNP